jgi:signal transduction histidine kinase
VAARGGVRPPRTGDIHRLIFDRDAPDDQDRAGSVPSHVLGDAPHEEATDGPAAVRADKDQVDFLRLGGRHDGLTRIAGPNEERDRETDRPAALDEDVSGCLAAIAELVDTRASRSTTPLQLPGVDDADDQQRGVVLSCERERPVGGEIGDRREVGRQEDSPDLRRGVRKRSHDRQSRDDRPASEVTFGPFVAVRPAHRIAPAHWYAAGVTSDSPASPRPSVDPTGPAVEALSDAVGAVAGTLEIEAVLQLIVDRVRALVGARYAALGILSDRRRIERFVTSGITADQRALLGPPPEGHGLLGLIITEGRSIRIPDIGTHPASYGFPANHPAMTTLLGVPVTLKNRVIGNLYLTDKADAAEFTDDDQRLVELFALHAGIAIENARLHAAVQHLAVVDERERIGKDLHDGIIQRLYAISLSLEDVEALMTDEPVEAALRVDQAIDSMNSAIADLRQFVVGLRPELVDRSDIGALLEALAEQVRQTHAVEVEVDVPAVPVDLSPHARGELLHIVREALSNVARHARASTVHILLTGTSDVVRIEVTDDGQGFDPDAPPRAGHFGLSNMAERAAALGGTMEVSSRRPGGTTIIVTIPIVPSAIGSEESPKEVGT